MKEQEKIRYIYRTESARILRKNETEAERLLWNELRNRKLCDLKFKRQHSILNYVVDFYCYSQKLIIAVDGGIHFNREQKEYDKMRQSQLTEWGYRVLRFKNDEVKYGMDGVLRKIKRKLKLEQ